MPEEIQDSAAGAAATTEDKEAKSVNATVEDVGPCKKKLAIEVPAEEVNTALRESILHLQKSAAMPGFRKGHAPLVLVEKRFGADVRREVKSNLVVDNYRKALEEKQLDAIAEPEIDLDAIEMEEGKPLSFELSVEVWPDFKPDGYEGLELLKPSTEPAESDIEEEIASLKTRTTTFKEITEEPAGEDDFLLCDYAIKSGEEEIASAKDVGLRPADEVVGRFKVKGLKKSLSGKGIGETIVHKFKIDKEHDDEALRAKDAEATVSIKGVRRPEVPEATDVWAKELGFESLEELRTVVGRNVAAGKERTADESLKRQVYDKLVEMMNFELPEDAVRRQQKDIFKRERLGLQYKGATEEDLAKINDKLEEASQEKAGHDLKLFFILSKIAEKEGIKTGAADIEMRIAELATRYRTTVAKMRRQLESESMLGQIAMQIQEEKTISHILSKATIKDAPPPAKQEKGEEGGVDKPKEKKAAEKSTTKKSAAKKSATKKSATKKVAAKKADDDKGVALEDEGDN